MAELGRLDDAAVSELLTEFDELIDRVEQVPGPTGESAIAAIQTLAALYGEALARIAEAAGPALVQRLADDALVGHLLLLHGLHPEPVESRVNRALAEAQPYLGGHGSAQLAGIDDGVARIRVEASGCGAADTARSVADIVLAEAPELRAVVPDTRPPRTVVQLGPVRHREGTP